MNDFVGVLRLQVEALLEALRRQQESRCRELIGEAEARARDLLRDSRRRLRERGRQAVDEERRRREAALKMARHRIRAAESQKVQALYRDLLRQASPALVTELERRWSSAVSRRAWCEKLLDEARASLGNDTWTIEHPDTWSAADTRWLTGAIKDRDLPTPSYCADSHSSAGLRFINGTACLDGTIEGLLTRRSRIEGRLLAAWERQARGSHE